MGAVFAVLVLPLLFLVLFHAMAAPKAVPVVSVHTTPATARFAFLATGAGELSLQKGDRVGIVAVDKQRGWARVRLGGSEGWVPQSYLAEQEDFFSLDVECAASGPRHHDRAPCRVALVGAGACLDAVVRVDHLVSPLTAITGLSRTEIAAGRTLDAVRDQVRSALSPSAVLVGQSIGHDIRWLGLVEGKDFKRSVDLAELFRCGPGSRVLSLEHEARGLLGIEVQQGVHSPVEDAQVGLRLFHECGARPDLVAASRAKLGALVASRQLPPRHRPPPLVDGVCMGAWSPACKCSQVRA